MTDPTIEALGAQRERQRRLLALVPDHIREVLVPAIDLMKPLPSGVERELQERDLRARVDALIGEEQLLSDYLARARRHHAARTISTIVSQRFTELAADGPEAMDLEGARAKTELDRGVESPTYEEGMLLARMVPLLAWADHLAGSGA
jgi:hypothetical protein